MITRSELMTATLRYIVGVCYEWEQYAKQFVGRPDDFYQFCLRTHDVCWKYMWGQKDLDGSCSDFECTTAIEMRAVFKPQIHATNYGG